MQRKKSWAQGYALLYPEKYGIAYVLKGQEKDRRQLFHFKTMFQVELPPLNLLMQDVSYLQDSDSRQLTFMSDYKNRRSVIPTLSPFAVARRDS
jgi:hypothetical protein